ncbi:MAG: DnaJ domain-containing protein [Myxococcales bacterium]
MSGSQHISGLGTRESTIHASADAEQRGLSREEQRLVSCAGTGARLGEVIERSGLPEPKAIALLLGLRLRGIIHPGALSQAPRMPEGWGARTEAAPRTRSSPGHPIPPVRTSSTPVPPSRPAAASGPTSATPIDLAAMAESVDLDDARKREILELEAKLKVANHFEVLGIEPTADAAAVKKAYYELTKRFHPDRFFGKSLGSFKARIDRVFKHLTAAQNVLSDPEKRKAYLKAHPELAPAAPAPSAPRADPRAAERRARLARHPYLFKRNKFNDLVASGRRAMENGDWNKALTDLNLAAQIEPKAPEVSKLINEARRGGDRGLAEAEYDSSISSETLGDMERAIVQMRKAVSLAPDNARYCHRLARMLMQSDKLEALKEAHLLARRATELAPANPEFHLTFAAILVRAGLEKNAIRVYEQVVKLRPDDAFAKDQLRRLKVKTTIIS